jgi:hypothetical protein
MIDPKARKQPKANIVADQKTPSDKILTMPASVPSHDRIKERAFELYEGRGGESGQDEQDWLRAEQEILKQNS